MSFWDILGSAPVIGGLVGLTKHFAVDKPNEAKQRELAARTQELSHWTGLKAQPVEDHNIFGDTLSGVTAGAQFGQSMDQAAAQNKMTDAYTKWIKEHTSRDPEAAMLGASQPFNYQPNSGYSWSLLK